MSRFNSRVTEMMKNPDFRAGYEEAQAELSAMMIVGAYGPTLRALACDTAGHDPLVYSASGTAVEITSPCRRCGEMVATAL